MTQKTESALFLVVKIYPRPDKLAEAEAQLHRMRATSMTEEGCVFMHLVQADSAALGEDSAAAGDEDETWVMLEQFTSRAAWDAHMLTAHNLEGNAALEPMLRQPSDLGLYRAK